MLVKNIMTTNIISVRKDTTINETAKILDRSNLDYLTIVDNNNKIIGYTTNRDIVGELSLRPEIINTTPIEKIMKKATTLIEENMDVHDACEIMAKEKKTTVPVINKSGLCGILSLNDLSKKKIFLAEVGEILYAINVQKN